MTKISAASTVKHSDVRGAVEGYASQGGVSLFGNMRTAANAEEGTEYFYHPSFVGSKDRLSNFRGFYRDTDAPESISGLYLVNAFSTELGFGWDLSDDQRPSPESSGGTTYNWNHVGTVKTDMLYQYELRKNGTLITSSSNNVGMDLGQDKAFASVGGLQTTSQYTFRVRCRDKAGNWTNWSGELTASTINPPATNTPPQSPTSGIVSGSWNNKRYTFVAGTDVETTRGSLTYIIRVIDNTNGALITQRIEVAPGYFQTAPATGYNDEAGFSIGSGNSLSYSGNNLEYYLEGLVSGRSYTVKVCCKDGGYNGAAPELSLWGAERTFNA